MWDVRACRGCLTVKCKLEKIGEASKRLYTALTGLQITDGDGYPNYFCVECRTQLRKCLAFRRKSRRAHFVLKEIMTVRKQVTYSDIVTVNRRKTNLESPLKFWDPQKTSSYLIINADEQDSLTELKPSSLTYSSNYTHIVDIKPEILNEEETIEKKIEEEETIEDNSLPDEIDIDPKEEEPVPADIDLNDVFKDLNDDNVISDNEEIREVQNDKDTKDKKNKDVLDKRLSVNRTVNALMSCTIKVLSLEEQKEKIEIRKRQEPFYHAQYKCSMCFTTYKSMELLIEHVNFHNERRFDHECQVCKNKFETVDELNLHIARTHMYEYKCKCKEILYSMYDLVSHHKRCGPILARKEAILTWFKMYDTTPLSDERLREIAAINAADIGKLEKDKPSDDAIQCDVCGDWVLTLWHMNMHMKCQHKFSYTCKDCKEVFTQRAQAKKHAFGHLENSDCVCKICGTTYKNSMALRAHCTKKHSVRVPCNVCGCMRPSGRAIYSHQLAKHKYISLNDPMVGDPQLKCTDCDVQFVSRMALETHLVLEEHAGAADVRFSCRPCKKVFENEDQLETHLITCNQPINYPRKCCYCEEMLLDKAHYKRHYTYVHPTLQYRYAGMNTICELCGKSIYKPHLEAHLNSHHGTAYECRYCGASNLDATMHVNHVLSQHSARPFCCTLCTRRFQHRSDCRDHILKVHAPAKLYRCEFCGLEFSYHRRLKDHAAKLHNLILPHIRIPKVTKLKVFVYAHMTIEINLLEKEAVEKCKVEMLDYLGQKSKPVDYESYFKFNSDADEYIVRIEKRMQKRKIPKQPKVKIESDIVIKEKYYVEDIKFDIKAKLNKEPKVEVEMLGTEVENAVREIQPIMKEEVVEMEQELVDEVVMGQETVDQVMEQGVVDQEMETGAVEEVMDQGAVDEVVMEMGDKPLEVFESDGYQYVMISGEMYKIASDCDE